MGKNDNERKEKASMRSKTARELLSMEEKKGTLARMMRNGERERGKKYVKNKKVIFILALLGFLTPTHTSFRIYPLTSDAFL